MEPGEGVRNLLSPTETASHPYNTACDIDAVKLLQWAITLYHTNNSFCRLVHTTHLLLSLFCYSIPNTVQQEWLHCRRCLQTTHNRTLCAISANA